MQKIVLILLTLVGLNLSLHAQNDTLDTYRASETRTFDLIHTQLDVSFDWEKQYLYGEANLALRPYFYAQQILNLDAKGMEIKNVVSMSDADSVKLAYDYSDDKLTIDLGKRYTRQDTLDIYIKYIAKPNEYETSGSEAITSDKGLYFINPQGIDPRTPRQIWTQGETEASSVWFPTIDKPNERCTQEISITVESRFKTLSNGLLVSEKDNGNGTRTDTWKLDQPHAPYLFMMAVGEFAVVKDDMQDLPISYWVEKDYAPYAKDIFGDTPEMIAFFSGKLNYPFPWPKYDQIVVRNFVSGAMENTTASLFMEDLQVNRRELIDFDWDGIIAHELIHQWFGNLVTCESWSNLTLNEGFANYSEYLWKEFDKGRDEADYHLLAEQDGYFAEAELEPKPLIRFYYDDKEDMFDSHSYNKGGAVLHMLRNYLGDELFYASLNKYLTDNAYQSVEVDNLRLAFESVSGEDLNWFFDQWFLSKGHPVLHVGHVYENDTLSLIVNQVQYNDGIPAFRLPVFVDILTNGEKASYPVVIDKPHEVYQFVTEERPELVVFDSERQLLAQITHPKTEEELLAQLKWDQSLYGRIEVLDSLNGFQSKKLIEQVLALAFNDPHYSIRQRAVAYLETNEVKPKKYPEAIATLINDPSSLVRASTLSYLGEIAFDDYQPAFQTALDDSSYLVVGTALAALIAQEAELPDEQVKSFSAETNINLVLSMAGYYLRREDDGSFDWFAQKLNQVKNADLYYFLQAYAEKLLYAKSTRLKPALEGLIAIARDNNNAWARLGAYQTLSLFSNQDGISEALNEIKANEKDLRLLEWYEQM